MKKYVIIKTWAENVYCLEHIKDEKYRIKSLLSASNIRTFKAAIGAIVNYKYLSRDGNVDQILAELDTEEELFIYAL